MERFYLRKVSNSATLVNRNTHDYITTVNLEDIKSARKFIKELCEMTTEEYVQYCLSNNVRFRRDNTSKGFMPNIEEEKWYTGAWSSTTDLVFKELGLKKDLMPNDTITIELVEECRRSLKEVASTKKITKSLPTRKKKVEEVEEVNPIASSKPPKKEVKPLPKPLPKKDIKETKSPLELLKEEYEKGSITTREFIRRKRKL